MAKKTDEAVIGVLVGIFIAAVAFIVIVGKIVYGWFKEWRAWRKKRLASSVNRTTIRPGTASERSVFPIELPDSSEDELVREYHRDDLANETGLAMSPSAIEAAIYRGDYETARLGLKKYAFAAVGKDVPADTKQRFKQLMTDFAQVDPLYGKVIARILPLVASKPGILQSSIYKHIPEFDQETIRYVLYFAHELGDIYRRKKGRSYELLLAGETIDGELS